MNWDVRWLDTTASTNADLAAAARDGAHEGTVMVTDNQTAGRGRLDRVWEAPAGSGIAASVLLRPGGLPARRWSWMSLLTGLAVADGIAEFGLNARLKWPNDVELDGRKVSGILVERIETSAGPAAVIGFGINAAMTEDQLPVPTATSLRLNGVDVAAPELLDAVLRRLEQLYALVQSNPDAVREAYVAASSTIGATVRVTLPDSATLEGTATAIDADGRLVVDGRAISAGDVVHVRNFGHDSAAEADDRG